MREEVKAILFEPYYCFFLMLGTQIIATAISYTRRKKFSDLKLYHFYLMTGLIQSVFSVINAQFVDRNVSYILNQVSVNIFLLVEIGSYYFISLRAARNRAHDTILTISLIFFIIACSYLWTTTDSFFYNCEKVYAVEALAMLIPATLFFFNLFKLPASINLFDEPLFWVNMGVFFTFFCILPLSLLDYFIKKFVENNYDLYYIVFACYSVNYCFVVRAYLCKPQNVIDKGSTMFAT